jgi:amino acid adenylation domain-containing protein
VRASVGQASLWFLRQVMPYKSPYNTAIQFRLEGRLDADVLVHAWREIVRRHESCRTTFASVDGVVMQVIHAALPADVVVVDVASAAEPEIEAEGIARAASRDPFDLEAGPLVRMRLVRLDDDVHRLVVVMDHIVADGMSLGVIWSELEILYRAFVAGEASPLPPPSVQYVECVDAQNEWLESPAFARQLDFWERHLKGAEPCDLPTDRPRPPVKSYRGEMVRTAIPAPLVDRIRALGKGEEVSFFTVVLAALEVLLARYSGQREVSLLVPVACRNRFRAERVVGYFANVIVLRNEVADDAPFRALLRSVSAEVLAGLLRQDVPFERVIERVRPERNLGHDPLASVALSFLPSRGSQLDLPGVIAKYSEISNGGSKFDLHLFMAEVGGEVTVTTEYNSDIFDRETVERFNQHYLVLLEAIADDPSATTGSLPLMSALEQRRVLVEWNETQAPFPRDRTVCELVNDRAASQADDVAVRFEGQTLTYGELARSSNQVARSLMSRGVARGDLVGIALERSLDLPVGLLGILKAGAAYVPLDPTYPRDRLALMAQDSGLRVLLTQEKLVGVAPSPSVLLVDGDREEIASQSQAPLAAIDPDSLAYVIYTSGSTGRPKGVEVPHRALTNLLVSMARQPGLSRDDRLLAVTSLSFDIAGLEIWLPLMVGAVVRIASRDTTTSGAALRAILDTGEISVLQATPSTFRLLLEAGWTGTPGLKVLVGGEATPRELADRLLDRTDSVWNVYGPTETTIWSCAHRLGKGEPVLIGRPIANTRVYVVDRNLRPVPPGIPGEICIAGDGLARGYLGRAELTRERFVQDPFSSDPAARMYRTGDLGRLRSDGLLEFLGRNDFQIKLRGYRIELGEIEACLATHPSVREAVVVAQEEEGGDRSLVAYVTRDSHLELDALRAHLRGRLPEYMVPGRFVLLDRLPLTANNKIDRKALPRAAPSANDGSARAMPRKAVEFKLKGIWEELLHQTDIGVDQSFFDLGGHSLLALKLFDRIEKAFGVKLPIATIFEAPTIERLGTVIGAEGWKPKWSSLVPLQPGGSRTPFFCVHGGGALVLFYEPMAKRLGPDQPFYGLQPKALSVNDLNDPDVKSVEAMAAHYLEEVREIQPRGPYLLGGASYGGAIALEMAQQLLASGEETGLLVMFDTYGPGYWSPPRGLARLWSPLKEAYLRMDHHVGSVLQLEQGERIPYLRAKLRKASEEAREVADEYKRQVAKGVFARMGRPLPPELEEVRNAVNEAVARYRPSPYAGEITLFRARHQAPGTSGDPTLGWGAIARSVVVVPMPGYHAAMISEPRVRELVPALRAQFDRARAAARGGIASSSR